MCKEGEQAWEHREQWTEFSNHLIKKLSPLIVGGTESFAIGEKKERKEEEGCVREINR